MSSGFINKLMLFHNILLRDEEIPPAFQYLCLLSWPNLAIDYVLLCCALVDGILIENITKTPCHNMSYLSDSKLGSDI